MIFMVAPLHKFFRDHHMAVYFLILLVSLSFIPGCENDPEKVKNLTSKNLGVEEGINVDINYTLAGKAKKIIGTTSHEDGKGIYRSASDVAIANQKMYVAEEDS